MLLPDLELVLFEFVPSIFLNELNVAAVQLILLLNQLSALQLQLLAGRFQVCLVPLLLFKFSASIVQLFLQVDQLDSGLLAILEA